MGLRDKYAHAIQTAKGVHMEGAAEEREGKLYFKGTTSSQDDANKIWDAIKTIPDWSKEVVADIKANPAAAASGATYTVKAGDNLSRISKQFYGDADEYMRIFYANRDKLRDPDKIQVGQQLTIPRQ